MISVVVASLVYIIFSTGCNAVIVSPAAYFADQAGFGFTAALAVPLDNGRADVFLSYCFGINIGQPSVDHAGVIDPPPFKKIYGDTSDKRQIRSTNLSRRKFYRIFMDNLKKNGYSANSCLLKAICEVAQFQFGSTNGVLGDIVHILFTPTTSRDERLSTRYYEAEMNGHLNLCDKKYGSKCPISIFDMITVIK